MTSHGHCFISQTQRVKKTLTIKDRHLQNILACFICISDKRTLVYLSSQNEISVVIKLKVFLSHYISLLRNHQILDETNMEEKGSVT